LGKPIRGGGVREKRKKLRISTNAQFGANPLTSSQGEWGQEGVQGHSTIGLQKEGGEDVVQNEKSNEKQSSNTKSNVGLD